MITGSELNIIPRGKRKLISRKRKLTLKEINIKISREELMLFFVVAQSKMNNSQDLNKDLNGIADDFIQSFGE